ncbi:serine/threonine protein phosphatase [Caproiciproducens sp. NJN-50]|uniref:serine/threonine protein phosphatase n=1 Tax=Acutalibacteraceae TaxID=3082771 RepID=UPI000FFE2399|nr:MULTISPECIES: serine/threonine protein phosphatase [Acutalibacteraceae]QAT48519.1 serine/threonine protein phosphatase [Caproiciproducens sp. NJN-50]
MLFSHKKNGAAVRAVQTAERNAPFSDLTSYVPLCAGERRLYDALREAVPIIDAAIEKILRLVGNFTVLCPDGTAQRELNRFLESVQAGGARQGISSFLSTYLDQLLTYGNAVGEMVVQGGELRALYNASLDDVELRAASPLAVEVRRRENGVGVPVKFPELVFCSALNPPPGSAQGVSLLRGLPFVSRILVQIFHTVGVNWERLGAVRFAVTYKPDSDAADQAFARERAEQIATEWGRAMRGDSVSDFIAVGDVSIRAIGSDVKIPDSEVPVRQILEQIIAKLGIPPFLLGLTWSSTERMSSQQADILTSELESYRRLLNPVIYRICSMWLRLNGFPPKFSVEWDDITLQDTTELAAARYQNARAAQLERTIRPERPVI